MSTRAALKSQYRAGLAMLRQAIEMCPDDLWLADDEANPFWLVAYHTLFYTDFYLRPDEAAFTPWDRHRPEYHRFREPPEGPRTAYRRDEVLGYLAQCDAGIDAAIDALDLDAPTSGFSWYPISKLEHQLANLRHLQHHTAQLSDRLRRAGGRGVNWVGAQGN